MNDKTDFDAIVDLLDRTAELIPASAPLDWSGDYRLYYLQFVADFNDLVRRAHDMKGQQAATVEQRPPDPNSNAPTIIG